MSDICRTQADLAASIRRLRKAKGVSSTELAQRIGRSRDLIWRLESGRDVSMSAVFEVLRALGAAVQVQQTSLPSLAEMRERFAEDD